MIDRGKARGGGIKRPQRKKKVGYISYVICLTLLIEDLSYVMFDVR